METIRCILEILEAEGGWIGGVQEVAGRASGSCGIFTHLLAPSVLLEGGHGVLRPQGNPRERSSRPAPTGGRGPQLETTARDHRVQAVNTAGHPEPTLRLCR